MRLDQRRGSVSTAVNVDDAPGRVRHVAADERRDCAADVIDRAPPPFGNQAVGDPLVVHLADVRSHVGGDDAGPHVEDRDARFRESDREQLRGHGERSLAHAVVAANR